MPILSLQTVKGYQQVLSPEQGKTKVSEEKSQEENPPVTFCLIVRSLQLVSCAAAVLRRKNLHLRQKTSRRFCRRFVMLTDAVYGFT